MRWLAALLMLSAVALAQPEASIRTVIADPGGNCVAHASQQFNERNGKQWACVDANGDGYGTWTWINQGIGGTGSIATTGLVLKGDGLGAGIPATPGTDYVIPSGTTAKATVLAADPANCVTGLPRGIDASGVAQNCAPVNVATEITGIVPPANGGMFVPTGTTTTITPGPSPYTYTAGGGIERLHISGGSVTDIKQNGVTLTTTLPFMELLFPGESVTVTYDETPNMAVVK
jgi:hypothetical protein